MARKWAERQRRPAAERRKRDVKKSEGRRNVSRLILLLLYSSSINLACTPSASRGANHSEVRPSTQTSVAADGNTAIGRGRHAETQRDGRGDIDFLGTEDSNEIEDEDARRACQASIGEEIIGTKKQLMARWAISSIENLSLVCRGFDEAIFKHLNRVAIKLPTGVRPPSRMDQLDFISIHSTAEALALGKSGNGVAVYVDLSDEDGWACAVLVLDSKTGTRQNSLFSTIWNFRRNSDESICLFGPSVTQS